MRVITPADHLVMPWKNGNGVTREIIRVDDDGRMLWRVSMAGIVDAGPFSDFSGYGRMLMLLDGPGFTLDCGNHGRKVLAEPGDVAAFNGGWPVQAVDVKGASVDLNLIIADSLTGYIGHVEEPGDERVPPRCRTAVVYAAEGSWLVSTADDSATIDAGDAAIVDAPQVLTFRGEGWAVVLAVGDHVLPPAATRV